MLLAFHFKVVVFLFFLQYMRLFEMLHGFQLESVIETFFNDNGTELCLHYLMFQWSDTLNRAAGSFLQDDGPTY